MVKSPTFKEQGQVAAMKPRTGSGPMEAVEESRKIVMRIPSDGGGRLVIELNKEEAAELGHYSPTCRGKRGAFYPSR